MSKKISINTDDFYRLLIAGCRYAYKRNNHLEPNYIYNYVKETLPEFLQVDSDMAIHTAKQLCDECIDLEIFTNFYDGKDDSNGNRASSIKFVNFLLNFVRDNSGEPDWKPYNYKLFEDNLKKN